MPDSIPIPGPAYRIQTSRLVVRCWEPQDASAMKAAVDANIEHLLPWLPWAAGEPQPLQSKIELIRRWRSNFDSDHDFVYGIFSADESRVVGGTGLHTRGGERTREIGYWIAKDCTHQGFATEISAALTKVAFVVAQMERVEIHCDPANAYSAAVPRKLGFTLEATLRRRHRTHDGAWRDTMIWTLLADEYPHSLAARAEIQAFDVIGRRLV